MIRAFFSPGNYPQNLSLALLLLRLASGGMMLVHGFEKFSKLFGDDPIIFADPFNIGAPASLALTVFAEVLCAIFLIVGFVTRLSAVPLLITMLVAVFVIHADHGFEKQELPLAYAVMYLTLAITGSGRFSVDELIFNRANFTLQKS